MKPILILSVMTMLATVSIAQQRTLMLSGIHRQRVEAGSKEEHTYLLHREQQNKKLVPAFTGHGKAGTGDMDTDLQSEWAELVVKPYNATDTPMVSEMQQLDGWNVKSRSGSFVFDGQPVSIQLTTFSGYKRCASIVTLSNSNEYSAKINNLMRSVHLLKPDGARVTTASSSNEIKHGYTFTSTNFDDGWTSTERPDWVEVTKGDIKVLIHYPNKITDAYNSVLKAGDMNAWNLLVAPRYKDVRNFEYGSIQSFQSVTFLRADATETVSGKTVHVVLFKLHDYQSTGRYLEIITSGRSVYEGEFGVYHNTEFGWDKVIAMQYRNKFAVAAADLIGRWSSTDFASLSYYYTATGGYAGSTATAVADEFNFLDATNYISEHSGASGQVGNMKFSQQKYNGRYTAGNWELQLTNRFNGQTGIFNCQFEAVKGGRILKLSEKKSSGNFTLSYTLVRPL